MKGESVMKKVLAIVISLVIIILSFASCSSGYDAEDFNFYDMEKQEARIVEIEDYNFEENYVLVSEYGIDIWGILNDNMVLYSRDISESSNDTYKIEAEEVDMTGTYTIIDDDLMSVSLYDEGEGTLSINSRHTHPTKNYVVVIEGKNNSSDALWINEDALDWKRGAEKVVLEENEYGGLKFTDVAYKVYFKNKTADRIGGNSSM